MAYPAYIRDKARSLRQEKKLTIDEIAERLGISRTTIFYWAADIPIDRKPPTTFSEVARQRASESNRRRFKRLRDEAYQDGRERFPELCRDPTFRHFVILFMTEGHKRNRNGGCPDLRGTSTAILS